jgi:AraC family transcriptional regulator
MESNRQSTRTVLWRSPVALVEDLDLRNVSVSRTDDDYSSRTQVCFPYRGAFIWHVGGEDVLGDANQVLFVRPGEEFSLTHARRYGCGELIITPDSQVLADLVGESDRTVCAHPLFHARQKRVEPATQWLSARFRRLVHGRLLDGVTTDAMVLDLLTSALDWRPLNERVGHATRRLVERAKEFLQAHVAIAVRLTDVACAVGASPAYLTHAFRRVEGVPLHGYLVQLRLARALVEVPHTANLTGLALTLGFSSHSHFSAVFRAAFGCTPSAFRRAAGPVAPTRARDPRSGRPKESDILTGACMLSHSQVPEPPACP